jgi:hypothetical protein
MKKSGGNTVRGLLKSVNTTRMSARPSMEPLGSGVIIPRATKNKVMKKSRSAVTFAVTSKA